MATDRDRVVIAQQGDMVDDISFRFYGHCGMTEKILEHNRGLADLGPILPQGTRIILPPRQATTTTQLNLWD